MGTAGKHFERTYTLTEYIQQKIDMIEKEFMIKLKHNEWARLKSCKSEDEADKVAHDIFMNRL